MVIFFKQLKFKEEIKKETSIYVILLNIRCTCNLIKFQVYG